MSMTVCPRCQGPLPESTRRAIPQGTPCPFCGFSLGPVAKPAAPPAKPDLRRTMVGPAIAPRALPFDGTPAPVSISLAAPSSPPVRAAVAAPPVRVVTAPASTPPVRGAASAAFARTIVAPAPARAASVRPAVSPVVGKPNRTLTPAQALDLPPPTPAPVLIPPPPPPAPVRPLVTASDSKPAQGASSRGAPALATVPPLVADSDSEPTHAAPPRSAGEHAVAAVPPLAPVLDDVDLESPIESVTVTPDLEEPPLVPVAAPLRAPARRGIAILGVGMGLAIVAVAAVGVKVLRRPPSAPAAKPIVTEVVRAAPAVEVVAPAPEPPAARAPAAPEPARAAKRGSRSAPEPAETSAASGDASGSHHHHHHHHAREVAVQDPVAPPAPKPAAAAAPKPAAPAPAERGDPRPHYERGNALLFAGDSKEAIGAYREAIRTAPNDPSAYRGLGLAYEQQGDSTAAIRALRRYLKLSPAADDREMVARRIERLGHKANK